LGFKCKELLHLEEKRRREVQSHPTTVGFEYGRNEPVGNECLKPLKIEKIRK
jgi:hypothetical protein